MKKQIAFLWGQFFSAQQSTALRRRSTGKKTRGKEALSTVPRAEGHDEWEKHGFRRDLVGHTAQRTNSCATSPLVGARERVHSGTLCHRRAEGRRRQGGRPGQARPMAGHTWEGAVRRRQAAGSNRGSRDEMRTLERVVLSSLLILTTRRCLLTHLVLSFWHQRQRGEERDRQTGSRRRGRLNTEQRRWQHRHSGSFLFWGSRAASR